MTHPRGSAAAEIDRVRILDSVSSDENWKFRLSSKSPTHANAFHVLIDGVWYARERSASRTATRVTWRRCVLAKPGKKGP